MCGEAVIRCEDYARAVDVDFRVADKSMGIV